MGLIAINHFFAGTLRRRLVTSVAVVQAVLMTIIVLDLTRRNEVALRDQQVAPAAALSPTPDASPVTTGMGTTIRDGAIYAAIAILTGSLLAWIMGNVVVRKILKIHEAMEDVRKGDLHATVVLSGSDEVVELADGFNRMLEAVRIRNQETTSMNASLEKRVAELTHQLKCANKELEAFTYSVSHDLRAPLRAIDGFSSFLDEGYGDRLDEEGRRLISVIRANTRKMDRLIMDVLALSRVTQGELGYARIDMQSMVKLVYNEVVPAEVRSQFKFTLEPMPEAWGDPALLRQVWEKLISNAVKYSMKSAVKEIVVGGNIRNSERVYYIKDAGAGFNPEYTSKLFGAFQRLHKADDFDGNGIGLAIVQRIIHRHEGSVRAQGKENAGATFSFSLPDRGTAQ